MTTAFDPTAYGTVPARSGHGMLALARALITAAQEAPVPEFDRRLVKVHSAATALRAAFLSAAGGGEESNKREANFGLDAIWAAIEKGLARWEPLAPALEQARQAMALRQQLFATGLGWLKAQFPVQWSESENRIKMIDEAVSAQLEKFVGKEFLDELQKRHALFGRVLGITGILPDPVEPPAIFEPKEKLRQAILSYARAVVGAVDEDDATSIQRAHRRLRPIDEMREKQAELRRPTSEPVEDPSTPIPTPPG